MVSERPVIERLVEGYHFRDNREKDDVFYYLNDRVSDRIYTALGGSRQAGRIFKPDYRLAEVFGISNHYDSRIQTLARELPGLVKGRSGTEEMDFRAFGLQPYKQLTVNDLIYDINVVTVNSKNEFDIISLNGRKSGTWIEIYNLPMEDIVTGNYPKVMAPFFNSSRLRERK